MTSGVSSYKNSLERLRKERLSFQLMMPMLFLQRYPRRRTCLEYIKSCLHCVLLQGTKNTRRILCDAIIGPSKNVPLIVEIDSFKVKENLFTYTWKLETVRRMKGSGKNFSSAYFPKKMSASEATAAFFGGNPYVIPGLISIDPSKGSSAFAPRCSYLHNFGTILDGIDGM